MRGRNRQQPRPQGTSEAQDSPTPQSSSTETGAESHSRTNTGSRSRSDRLGTPASGTETTPSRTNHSAVVVGSPAVKFITRPDFIEVLNSSGVGKTLTFASSNG